jgi:hypothetical protein
MNKVMKEIGKKDLSTIANELITKYNADAEKIKFLLTGRYESRLQEMLYRKSIGDSIEWLYIN